MAEAIGIAVVDAASAVFGEAAVAGAVSTYASALTYVTIGQVALGVAAVSYNLYEQKQAAARARATSNGLTAIRGRTETFKASVMPARTIYGRLMVGGVIVYEASCGPNNSTLVQVIALASHEVDAIEEVYFNNEKVVLEGHGFVTSGSFYVGSNGTAPAEIGDPSGVTHLTAPPIAGSIYAVTDSGQVLTATITDEDTNEVTVSPVPSEPYSLVYQYQGSKMTARVIKHLGNPGQYCDEVLNGLLPNQWDASHIGNDIAYLVCIFEYDQSSFPNGVPSVSAVVRGKKLFDPRTGETKFSENPALMMRDWMLSPFGGRKSEDCIDDNSIAFAANVCDTPIDYSRTFAPPGVPA